MFGENRGLIHDEGEDAGSRPAGRRRSLTGLTALTSLIWSIALPLYILSWILLGFGLSAAFRGSRTEGGVLSLTTETIAIASVIAIVNAFINICVMLLSYSKVEPSPRIRTLYFLGWVAVTIGNAGGIAFMSFLFDYFHGTDNFLVILYVGVPLAVFAIITVLSAIASYRVRARCSCRVPQRY